MALFVDTRNSTNDIDMVLDVEVGNTEIMKIDLKNTGTRNTISPTDIQIPTMTIDADEAFEEVYDDLY